MPPVRDRRTRTRYQLLATQHHEIPQLQLGRVKLALSRPKRGERSRRLPDVRDERRSGCSRCTREQRPVSASMSAAPRLALRAGIEGNSRETADRQRRVGDDAAVWVRGGLHRSTVEQRPNRDRTALGHTSP